MDEQKIINQILTSLSLYNFLLNSHDSKRLLGQNISFSWKKGAVHRSYGCGKPNLRD